MNRALVSLATLLWAVAGLPQVVASLRADRIEGVSLTFLMLIIAADLAFIVAMWREKHRWAAGVTAAALVGTGVFASQVVLK